MKHVYFFFLLLLSVKLGAQTPIEVTADYFLPYPMATMVQFETPGDSTYILRDTTAVPQQLWQIGNPQKTVFTAPISGYGSLVTDTVNTYPVGAHAAITVKVINYEPCWGTTIQFAHRMNTTTGQDGGTIAISHDNGISWYTIFNDPYLQPPALYTTADTVAALGEPGFSGNINDVFALWFDPIYQMFTGNDTFLIRLTFASDSTAEALDGWMLDELNVSAICEGVHEYNLPLPLDFGPNPTNGKIFLRSPVAEKFDVEVHDSFGRLVFREAATASPDLSALPDGCYFLQARNGEQVARKKLIVLH